MEVESVIPDVHVINEHNMKFSPSKEGDVGHDLYATPTKQTWIERIVSELIGKEVLIVWPWRTRMVDSGIRLGLPSNLWAMVTARSSTARKQLLVLGGIIDSGYQGQLFTVIANFSFMPRFLVFGERYSQVLFFPSIRPQLATVGAFQRQSSRGASGFGSSGK
jgi:dUTP pyrophosphatase